MRANLPEVCIVPLIPALVLMDAFMFDDWIDVLLSGTFEIQLPTLSVTGGVAEPMQGSGTLCWQTESGIRLQAVTDGARSLVPVVFGSMPLPGTLVPHSSFLTFTGQTQCGWDVTTFRTHRDGFRLYSDRPEVVWDLPIDGVTLVESENGRTSRLLRILMGPLPYGGWTRVTETEKKNEYFGGRGFQRDWMYSQGGFGQVAAWQRSGEWFEVRIFPTAGKLMGDADKLYKAVARAFGFILGRRSAIRGYEEIDEGKTTRRLDVRCTMSTKNTILSPLGWQLTYLNNVERLLGLTIDFFLTDLGERVASFLYLCWDSADNAYDTQLAISSICVEGLLRVATETMGPAKPDDCSSDFAALEKWVEGTPPGFNPQFLRRLLGQKHSFSTLSPQTIFRDWISRGLLGMTMEDMKSWSVIRNAAVHGNRATTPDSQSQLQIRVNRHARIISVLNRIILMLIGYTGEYIDYSQPGYPPAIFPADPVVASGDTES